MAPRPLRQQGFTLVELMICVAIIAILFAVGSVNFGHAETTVTVGASTDGLLADIKSQQLLAMAGEMGSTTTDQPHGIYVQPHQYTLYSSANFNINDTNNFVFVVPSSITFASTLPSGKLLFKSGDGSVNGFVAGNNIINVSGLDGVKTITIDRFGATTVN